MSPRPTANSHDEPILQTVAEPLHQLLKRQAVSANAQETGAETLQFRPTDRQPLATLTILDDGSRKEGDVVRIRDSRLVIGREEGHVTIPFDSDMSGLHAELRCETQDGKFQWYLNDLGSTNGTFLRAYRASLSKELQLMLLGSRRYVFQLPAQPESCDEADRPAAPSGTIEEQCLPRLLESGSRVGGNSFTFAKIDLLLGRDAACDFSIPDDPFLSPRHARFYQDKRSRWMVEDKKSLNGVWLRIKRMPLTHQAEFQLGQQRFRFQPGTALD